jgi:hypothetical protein
MAKAGRPSSFSREIADKIVERMIEGEELAKICRDPAMPARRTVYDWQRANEEFRAQCARAREGLADWYDDRITEVINNVTEANVNASRVKLSGLQWKAAKAAPKRFGEKVEIDANVQVTDAPSENLTTLLSLLEKARVSKPD